jgi:glycosyltransferase involved in cell wall biosynthesis
MKDVLQVAAVVSGENDPSSRFRVLQHVGPLADHGIRVRPFIPMISAYPPRRHVWRPFWGGAVLAERFSIALATHRSDVTLLQRTMVSTLYTLEPLCRRPRILDVDDAIHLHRGGNPARRVAEQCNLVICGNEYLAAWYSGIGCRTAVLPTAVDTQRWRPAVAASNRPCVGWIGSSSNSAHLEERQESLLAFLNACPDWVLRVVSDVRPEMQALPADRWVFIPWTKENEVLETAGFSIGLMPLRDGEWERGKCSYKMLLYMACGIPVVVSPVGVNREILARSNCGLAAVTEEEWTAALVTLANDCSLREAMGKAGRATVERDFSVEVIAPKLADLIRMAEQGVR